MLITGVFERNSISQFGETVGGFCVIVLVILVGKHKKIAAT